MKQPADGARTAATGFARSGATDQRMSLVSGSSAEADGSRFRRSLTVDCSCTVSRHVLSARGVVALTCAHEGRAGSREACICRADRHGLGGPRRPASAHFNAPFLHGDKKRRFRAAAGKAKQMRYVLAILIVMGLFVEAVSLSQPAQAQCRGQQCCGYGQTYNYREQTCEVPGSGVGR